MRRALAALAAVPVLWASCGNGDDPTPGTPDDAGPLDSGIAVEVDVGAEAGDPAFPWDPVWHETKPKAWPQRGPEGLPSCGPGCRIAVNFRLARPRLGRHAFSTDRIIDTALEGLVMTSVGGTSTSTLLPLTETNAAIMPDIRGDTISYIRGKRRDWHVEIMNVVTGETKPVYKHHQPDGDAGFEFTVLNDKYVFWSLWSQGLMSRNLATGEVRSLVRAPFTCTEWCATDGGVVCADYDLDVVSFTDQETGKRTVLDGGGAAQFDGLCSADRTKVAWIDHRDPAGGTSTRELRYGGEVYVRDLVKGETKRVTFDSPSNPLVKLEPAVDGNTVIFFSVTKAYPRSPVSWDHFARVQTLERVDLDTGKRCKIDPFILRQASLHGRHAYGLWYDKATFTSWLVDIDLDSPDLPWSCE